MEVQKTDEATRLRRERTKQAINAAMESRWEDAVAANKLIIESDASDAEALNRLGKAASELGRYDEARDAFTKALAVSPHNAIAKKNLERLNLLGKNAKGRAQHTRVPPQFFIEETGKTGVVAVVNQASKEVLARISAGEPVNLEAKDHRLVVTTTDGDYLGIVDPKVGLRLLSFVRGGNKYAAAVSSIDISGVKLFVRETYQHVSQRGRLAFLPKGLEDLRPYVWEGSRLDRDEEAGRVAAVSGDWEDDELEETPRLNMGFRRAVPAGAEDEDEY